METLLKEAHEAWRKANAEAVAQCHSKGDHAMAEALAACQLFKGDETLEELAKLMFSPRGAEFITAYHFPSIELLRKLKAYAPETLGIYIDAGEITLKNEPRVFLAGDTTATLAYTQTACYRVVAIRGAKADIQASGYAIVHVEKEGDLQITTNKKDFALVLC